MFIKSLLSMSHDLTGTYMPEYEDSKLSEKPGICTEPLVVNSTTITSPLLCIGTGYLTPQIEQPYEDQRKYNKYALPTLLDLPLIIVFQYF